MLENEGYYAVIGVVAENEQDRATITRECCKKFTEDEREELDLDMLDDACEYRCSRTEEIEGFDLDDEALLEASGNSIKWQALLEQGRGYTLIDSGANA
ncbi:hypothetical protein SAMN04488047_13922 [Tranquillimonas alkanivorans]|uniref:Uncharacterized protein n=2 Tax=Tranquillimonas alkanivorans TaxID=441119 RepID=A0A1I5W319_9RHOB|nr:hypothetical protein SAMN04488047_13922 [Tranquillimonas alkanivorans]